MSGKKVTTFPKVTSVLFFVQRNQNFWVKENFKIMSLVDKMPRQSDFSQNCWDNKDEEISKVRYETFKRHLDKKDN